jgi:cardiolipin synthase (CMP-forming)
MTDSRSSPYALRDAFRLPGLITLLRLPLALVFPWAARSPGWAVALMAFAATTDVLDGWIARATHAETATGAVLDALLDKLFVLVVALTLLFGGRLTVGEALMLAVRDLGEGPLLIRRVLHQRLLSTRTPTSNALGKTATVFQFVALATTLVGAPGGFVWYPAAATLGLAAAASYWLREARPGATTATRRAT